MSELEDWILRLQDMSLHPLTNATIKPNNEERGYFVEDFLKIRSYFPEDFRKIRGYFLEYSGK